MPNIMNLTPAVLYDGNGVALAPQTMTSEVYTSDGQTVAAALTDLKNTSNEVIYTDTQVIEATFNQQCIFNLKYPIDGYDITKFPLVVIARNEIVDPSFYRINNNYPNDDQLLFNTAKIPAFNAGETIIVIMHYSKTIYSGNNVDANSVNNIFMEMGAPQAGAQLKDNSIFFDFNDSQIIYYKDGVKQYFPIGSSKLVTSSKTITSSTQSINIADIGYNKNEDVVLIYENNTYISQGDYYTIDDNLVMRRVNNIIWQATSYEPITFDFVVQKRAQAVKVVASDSISDVVYDGSITMKKLSLELQEQIKEMQDTIDFLKNNI